MVYGRLRRLQPHGIIVTKASIGLLLTEQRRGILLSAIATTAVGR